MEIHAGVLKLIAPDSIAFECHTYNAINGIFVIPFAQAQAIWNAIRNSYDFTISGLHPHPLPWRNAGHNIQTANWITANDRPSRPPLPYAVDAYAIWIMKN